MGYRIEYGQSAVKIPIIDKKKKRFPFLLIGVGVLLAAMLLPQTRVMLRDFLLPGDSAVTAAAMETFIDDLQAGQSIGEAVTVFCREIIAGGP